MCGKERVFWIVLQSYEDNFYQVQEMRVIASYCELATLILYVLTYIYVGLRKIKVSDGFRRCWVSRGER